MNRFRKFIRDFIYEIVIGIGVTGLAGWFLFTMNVRASMIDTEHNSKAIVSIQEWIPKQVIVDTVMAQLIRDLRRDMEANNKEIRTDISKTKARQRCDRDAIREIAKKHNMYLEEYPAD